MKKLNSVLGFYILLFASLWKKKTRQIKISGWVEKNWFPLSSFSSSCGYFRRIS